MTVSPSSTQNRFLQMVLAAYALVWIGTAINPRDWLAWALENILVVIFADIIVVTYRRFTFSNSSYLLIALFLSLHAVGTHTGYAHSPIGDWLKEALDLRRNPKPDDAEPGACCFPARPDVVDMAARKQERAACC